MRVLLEQVRRHRATALMAGRKMRVGAAAEGRAKAVGHERQSGAVTVKRIR